MTKGYYSVAPQVDNEVKQSQVIKDSPRIAGLKGDGLGKSKRKKIRLIV